MPSINLRQNEKRSCPRYAMKDHSAVFLTPGEIVSYKVLDFGQSGMSFCYKSSTQKSQEKGYANVIFFSESIDSLEIPVQIISDTIMKNQGLRRCGVRFCFLSQLQERKILSFIAELQQSH